MNSSKNQHENTIANIIDTNVKNTMHHEQQHLAPQRIKLVLKKHRYQENDQNQNHCEANLEILPM
jgi:hypothetical protein